MKNKPNWVWPNGKRIAVVFNVCLEAWSDGKAPGISPMGNPLPAGVLDTMAISWAAYGVEVGIHRLMDGFARHGAKASVMTNAVIAERAPGHGQGHRRARPRSAVAFLRHGRDPGAIVRRGRAQEHRALHRAPGKSLGPKDHRLAVAARHLEAVDAETARRRRLSLVRRRVRHRPALRRQPRQQARSSPFRCPTTSTTCRR